MRYVMTGATMMVAALAATQARADHHGSVAAAPDSSVTSAELSAQPLPPSDLAELRGAVLSTSISLFTRGRGIFAFPTDKAINGLMNLNDSNGKNGGVQVIFVNGIGLNNGF